VKVIKNIFILLITLVFFISSNGFFFEEYLCFSCNLKHNEVTFFEFEELKHNHSKCTACVSNGHVCDCCSENAKENKEIPEIKYYSLDVVYQDNFGINLKQIISKNLTFNLNIWDYVGIHSITTNKLATLFKQIKIPPIISNFKNSTALCTAFSIFRL
jgi:hypothetical protein